jgi:hypothetical protein
MREEGRASGAPSTSPVERFVCRRLQSAPRKVGRSAYRLGDEDRDSPGGFGLVFRVKGGANYILVGSMGAEPSAAY